MTIDTILRSHDILVKDGTIEKISSEIIPDENWRIIDAENKFIIPGLSDMHVHLERMEKSDLLLFLLYGVTNVRNMDGRPYILEWKKEIQNGKIIGPNIYTAGPILEGERPFWEDTKIVNTKEEARKAFRSQMNQGYDFIKVYHTLGLESYQELLQLARKRGVYVAGHVPNQATLPYALKNGQKSIEHFDGYFDEIESADSPYKDRWSWLKMYFAAPIDHKALTSVVEITKNGNTWNVPTLIQKEKIGTLDTLEKWHNSEIMDIVPGYMKKEWSPINFQHLSDLTSHDLDQLQLGKTNRFILLSKLFSRTGKILAGTDTPNPYVIPGISLIEELLLFSEAGLSSFEALQTATSKAAEFSEASSWGEIEIGKEADLVFLNSNPLENLKNLKDIFGVMVDGKWIDPVERNNILVTLAEKNR